ncbi:MAG: hypothetical protein M1814_005027 [Vezdaea aestivalis]|nr:MAG: hypothetical protein M1814_005027 [Vezdaea aestivalis]
MSLPLFGESLPQRPLQRQSRISNLRFTFSSLFSGSAASSPPSPTDPNARDKQYQTSPTPPLPQLASPYLPISPSAYSQPTPVIPGPISPGMSILSLYRSPTIPSPTYARNPAEAVPGADPEEQQLAELVHRERHRRRHKHRRRRAHGQRSQHSHRSHGKQRHCCFPSVTDPLVRPKFFHSLLSGLALTIFLTIYLSLALSNSVSSRAFHVLFILVILALTIFFCHSLIRLCMLSMRPRTLHQTCQERLDQDAAANRTIPDNIIILNVADEEEALSLKDEEVVKCPPPAYGLWRGSVRVDPNRHMYWHGRSNTAYPNHPAFRPDGLGVEGEERPTTATQPPEYEDEEGRAF